MRRPRRRDPRGLTPEEAAYWRYRKLYDNCRVLSPEGELMFLCERRRWEWYLAETPSEKISDDPPTLRLLFQPGGPGFAGDVYHLSERLNRCVVCGSEEWLGRHHILPHQYRIHYPRAYRRRNFHDVVPVCHRCHHDYERQADALKIAIAREHGVPVVNPPRFLRDRPVEWVRSLARALLEHGAKMPAVRRAVLLERVAAQLQRAEDTITTQDLEQLMALSTLRPNPQHMDYGRRIMAAVDLQAFLECWRRHFVETTRARFMPAGWRIERPLQLDDQGTPKPFRSEMMRLRRQLGLGGAVPWRQVVAVAAARDEAREKLAASDEDAGGTTASPAPPATEVSP